MLKPAAAQLQGRTSLIIVPDGALWELPFQALQPAPTRYLIEDCAIAYAPSLTALREMIKLRDRKKDSAGSPTLLAFGNPALGKQTIARVKSVLMDEKLDPLPEAERQVNVMKQIYGSANSKVYIGAEAREERAKAEAGGYRILHLATHGILNDSSPMYSHVLLAQDEGDANEDGLLEAWEIMKTGFEGRSGRAFSLRDGARACRSGRRNDRLVVGVVRRRIARPPSSASGKSSRPARPS